MNAFPEDYIVHNLPLIVLSGLGSEQDDRNSGEKVRTLLSEGGFRIKIDLPPVQGVTAETLLQTLLSCDSTEKPWNGGLSGQLEQNVAFRIRSTGRTYTLPPRKAPPPAHSPRLRPATDGKSPPPQLVLHSPISPLTPSSPLYPDGIMTPLWITKHQSRLPSMFISFFTLVSDPNASTLQDNKIKSEVHNIYSVLSSTNYKTKLMIVLVGDGPIAVSDMEERLSNIRRATNLDYKSLLYLPSDSSQQAVSEFSKNMLDGMYAGCVEYYRDLSKHARRKRNRNIVPQPTVQPSSGTSRTLPLAGWNVRYEFKLGVFAEFRQEMEAALRNYETAYESLFGAEVFETIPSWSPRFNEARLLSDIIVIRSIRCLLWLRQTTHAVRWWTNHRNRIQSLIDRRSTGTETYGWEAWQSTWSRTMAELIRRSRVLSERSSTESSPLPIFVDAEKSLPVSQRFSPWENLHHEGYWLDLAQRYTRQRRNRALQMPEEDRASPGQSPASVIASKAHLYDKYLTLEPYLELPLSSKPGYDYSRDITEALNAAIDHFSAHGQIRMVEVLQLRKATEHIKSQVWSDALPLLDKVWHSQSWRRAGWWNLLQCVGQALCECAAETGQTELIARLQWEFAHPILNRGSTAADGIEIPRSQTKAQAALDTENSLAQYIPTFAFACADGHVGEPMDAQLSLHRIRTKGQLALQLSQVKIVFEGGMRPIYIIHDDGRASDSDTGSVIIADIELEDARSRTAAKRRASLGATAAVSADLNLVLEPGQTKVFQMQIIPREAGDVSVASIMMSFENSQYELTITTSNMHHAPGEWWEMQRGKPTLRPCGRQRDACSVKILPKPPKLEVRIPDMRKVYYTNETIDIAIQLVNCEEEDVVGDIQTRLISPGKNNAKLKSGESESLTLEQLDDADAATFIQKLPSKEFGKLQVGDHTTCSISINNADEAIDHELEIAITYSLSSTPDSKLNKYLTADLPIVRPFEVNFSFHARLHEEAWPKFFSPSTVPHTVNEAFGIKQQYLITAVIGSFAVEDIVIESTRLATQKLVGDATCTITEGKVRLSNDQQLTEELSSVLVRPEETKRFGFDMILQKLVLGDRQPVAVDVLLEILWKRKDSDCLNTSTLPVPRFLAPSSEPRVLLRLSKDRDLEGLYRLSYTIENPSLHFLTFNLTMESSDDFAFSGTKNKSLSLVPISRHEVVYRILSNKSKAWVKVHLDVVDAYFGQTLKIQPASDGIRVDKQGHVFVWVE